MLVVSTLRLIAIPVCFILFLKGFFPLKDFSNGYSTKKFIPSFLLSRASSDSASASSSSTSTVADVVDSTHHRTNSMFTSPYKRVVLMIIDALRNDFVHGPFNYLPHTKVLLDSGHGLAFTAQTHPPTVTLPRIKAITTGAIPGFIDVVLNFGSTALMEDNIVTQMKINKKKVVFYGDDTWINLFPNHFAEYDGTTSFFVTDYTEVDNNVTRHLASKLQSNVDWDVMILHYLGLDHIGHMSGPNSPLIRPKLAEMDGVIGNIFSAMKTWETEGGVPSLLVICGDHGMSDQGGHGGSSPSEVLVPLVFLSPGMKTKDPFRGGLVSQIDLCPTLAVLLGLPVPLNSLGKTITDTLVGYSLPQKVSVLHQNAQHVLKVFKSFVKNLEQESAYILYTTGLEEYKKWLDAHGKVPKEEWQQQGHRVLDLYSESLSLMSEKVGRVSSQYDVYVMMASITLLWMILASLLVSQLKKDSAVREPSISKHLMSTVPILGSVLMSHIIMCTGGVPSALMCGSSLINIAVQLVMATVLVSSMLHLASTRGRVLPLKQQIKDLRDGKTITEWFLILATMAHTFTLLSSSFVEEEHQTFYFLTTSIHVLLLLQLGFRFLKSHRLLCQENTKGLKCDRSRRRDGKCNCVKYGKACQRLKEGEEADNAENGVDNLYNEIRSSSRVDDADLDEAGQYVDMLEFNQESAERPANQNYAFKEISLNDKNKYEKVMRSEESDNIRGGNSASVKYVNVVSRTDALHTSVSLVVILVFLRVLRRWNQTGNKWLDVPDVGDWLVNPNNKAMLSFAMMFSLLIVSASRYFTLTKLQATCVNLSLVATYMCRAATGALIFPDKRFMSSSGVPEARASYFLMGVTVVISVLPFHLIQMDGSEKGQGKTLHEKESKERKKSITDGPRTSQVKSQNTKNSSNLQQSMQRLRGNAISTQEAKDVIRCHEKSASESLSVSTFNDGRAHILNGFLTAWLCFMCLVLRPHNAPVVAAMSLIEQMAVYVLVKSELKPTAVLLYCLWMGHAFFFFQGNSNSISTVDIMAGYVGMTDYNPSIIGLLMALSTYSGHIFWMLSFLRTMCLIYPGKGNTRLKHVIQQSLNGLALKILFPLAIYCIVVSTQRFHLFVWTVFSPKLLYQAMETLVLSVIALCLYCSSYVIA